MTEISFLTYIISIAMSILSVSFIIISYFITRTLKQIDSNQGTMANDMKLMEIKLAKIIGQHEAVMQFNLHKSYD